MSNVILLDFSNTKRKPREMPDGASAEICIFHGVRVERLTDEMIEQSMPRQNGRRIPALHNQATATELDQ